MSGWLPSTRTQVSLGVVQGGIANEVAYDHASRGCDPGVATKHGANVGGAVTAWWLFVLCPSVLFSLTGIVIWSNIYWIWLIGLDLGAWGLKSVLDDWRKRDVGTPSRIGLHGGFLAAAWGVWFVAIWPVAILFWLVTS